MRATAEKMYKYPVGHVISRKFGRFQTMNELISVYKEVPALHCNVFEALTRETLANEIHSNSKLRWDHMSGSLLTKIIVYVFFLLYFSTSSILYP